MKPLQNTSKSRSFPEIESDSPNKIFQFENCKPTCPEPNLSVLVELGLVE